MRRCTNAPRAPDVHYRGIYIHSAAETTCRIRERRLHPGIYASRRKARLKALSAHAYPATNDIIDCNCERASTRYTTSWSFVSHRKLAFEGARRYRIPRFARYMPDDVSRPLPAERGRRSYLGFGENFKISDAPGESNTRILSHDVARAHDFKLSPRVARLRVLDKKRV